MKGSSAAGKDFKDHDVVPDMVLMADLSDKEASFREYMESLIIISMRSMKEGYEIHSSRKKGQVLATTALMPEDEDDTDSGWEIVGINRELPLQTASVGERLAKQDLTCLSCDETFISRPKYQRHLASVHKAGLDCPHCDSACFSQPGRLARHINQAHSSDTFECEYEDCSKTYPTRKSLEEHVSWVHKPRDESWTYCKRSDQGCDYGHPAPWLTRRHEEHYCKFRTDEERDNEVCGLAGCELTFQASNVDYHRGRHDVCLGCGLILPLPVVCQLPGARETKRLKHLATCESPPQYQMSRDAFGLFGGDSSEKCTVTTTCEYSTVENTLKNHQARHILCPRKCGHIFDVHGDRVKGHLYIDDRYLTPDYARDRAEHLMECINASPAEFAIGAAVLATLANPDAIPQIPQRQGAARTSQAAAMDRRVYNAVNRITGAPVIDAARGDTYNHWKQAGPEANATTDRRPQLDQASKFKAAAGPTSEDDETAPVSEDEAAAPANEDDATAPASEDDAAPSPPTTTLFARKRPLATLDSDEDEDAPSFLLPLLRQRHRKIALESDEEVTPVPKRINSAKSAIVISSEDEGDEVAKNDEEDEEEPPRAKATTTPASSKLTTTQTKLSATKAAEHQRPPPTPAQKAKETRKKNAAAKLKKQKEQNARTPAVTLVPNKIKLT